MPSSIASSVRSALGKVKKKATKVVKSIASSISGSHKSRGKGTIDLSSDDGDTSATPNMAKWTSGVYQFFKNDVQVIKDTDGSTYQQFNCAAPRCKKKSGHPGVRRMQTKADGTVSHDRSSTSNLKKHAVGCWGKDVVEARLKGVEDEKKRRDGNLFSSFAKQGQRPVKTSHRAPTNAEFHAHLVRWIAESNRPLRIVEDRELRELLEAGHPGLKVPGRDKVARDIASAYAGSALQIGDLLKDYPGRLSFSTDAWTSPNHRAFVAWTVHLQHEGHPLTFLLDIVEVPESQSGDTLAREFHEMLSCYGLEAKILSWTGDNATSNDTQNTALGANPNNSFDAVNRVRCFNHILNLAVKAFLRPFQPRKKKTGDGDGAADDAEDDDDGDELDDLVVDLDDSESLPDLAEASDAGSIMSALTALSDEDNALDSLGDAARTALLAETSSAKTVLNRVREPNSPSLS